MSAAPKTAAEYLADARRFDAAAVDAEDAGDGLGADRMRVRAKLARRAAEGARFAALRVASKGGAQ